MPVSRSRRIHAAQGLLVALAAVLVGVALVLGDVTIPRSPLGGGLVVLAGLCWGAATIVQAQRPSRASTSAHEGRS